MKPLNFKTENSTVTLHVNLTLTMHNLLSSIHNCVLSTKLIETYCLLEKGVVCATGTKT